MKHPARGAKEIEIIMDESIVYKVNNRNNKGICKDKWMWNRNSHNDKLHKGYGDPIENELHG